VTPVQVHVAQERAAVLLAGLVRHGVRDIAQVRAVPPLAEALPDEVTPEGLAASHHRVFSLEAPPIESFWCSPDRLLGGDRSDAVARAYRLGGFAPRVADVSPDHLGVQLSYIGWLAGARAHASEDSRPDQDARVAALEQDFVQAHVLRWLPALVVALDGLAPFWERVLELSLSLVQGVAAGSTQWVLPPVPDLSSPETSVRDISRVLCTPALAGGLLTRTALAELGRADSLLAGFGAREQTLANLVRSAARFDRLDALLARLDARFAALGAAGGPWGVRCGETRSVLGRLRRLADDAGPG